MKTYYIKHCSIDITHGCQLRCVGCPNSILQPKVDFMPVNDFRTCIRNLEGVRYIRYFRLFNFGEPLLHPELLDICDVLAERTFKIGCVELSTNGQHLRPAVLEQLFKKGTLNRLVVSCDGDGTAAEYERLRPPGKWNRLIEFLTVAGELKKRFAPDLKIITRTICSDPEAQQRWNSILLPLGWQPEFRDWLQLPDTDRAKNSTQRVTGVCRYLQLSTLYVEYNGDVVPCCAHPMASNLGNLLRQNVHEIMGGDPRRQFRKLLKTSRSTMHICGECGIGSVFGSLLTGAKNLMER